MQTTPKSLDFAKVEVLRRHMLLTTHDMSVLLGVSRATYYGWVRGKPIRKKNEADAKRTIRKLLDVVSTYNWPTQEVVGLSPPIRLERLLALLQHTA